MSAEFHIVSWVVALYTPERASDIAETVHQFLIDSGQVSDVDTWVIHPGPNEDGPPQVCPWCGHQHDSNN